MAARINDSGFVGAWARDDTAVAGHGADGKDADDHLKNLPQNWPPAIPVIKAEVLRATAGRPAIRAFMATAVRNHN